jgi:tRNA(Ser,Leu) C12 N-acetylase TAN1
VEEEVPDCLYRLDPSVKVERTRYGGVLKVAVSIPARLAAERVKSCWTSHVSRVIPVDAAVKAELAEIAAKAVELARGAKGSIAVRCVKRGGCLSSAKRVEEEVGAALRRELGLTVSLEDPDYEVRVEVLGEEAYLSLLSRRDREKPRRTWPPAGWS